MSPKIKDGAAFTLYWLDGQREVVHGATVAEAMNAQGYGAGVLKALDFYALGEDAKYEWNERRHKWEIPGIDRPISARGGETQ